MSAGAHDHGTSALATLLGVTVGQVAPTDSVWAKLLLGVATTVLGWCATRALSALERWWKGRKG